VYLVSESLGTGPAAWLAGHHADRVQGLCCLVPYDRLVRVARHQMPWLPVEVLLLDRFPAADWLRDSRCPAAFCVAGADQVIPPARGLHLHESYTGPKRLWVLPGVDHNGALARPTEWWREVVALWTAGPHVSHSP
jgi:pimeloyl-ACP methyl ester carboxylesterase